MSPLGASLSNYAGSPLSDSHGRVMFKPQIFNIPVLPLSCIHPQFPSVGQGDTRICHTVGTALHAVSRDHTHSPCCFGGTSLGAGSEIGTPDSDPNLQILTRTPGAPMLLPPHNNSFMKEVTKSLDSWQGQRLHVDQILITETYG